MLLPILYIPRFAYTTCANDYTDDDDDIWHAVLLENRCDISHTSHILLQALADMLFVQKKKEEKFPSKSKRCGLAANFIYPFEHHTLTCSYSYTHLMRYNIPLHKIVGSGEIVMAFANGT